MSSGIALILQGVLLDLSTGYIAFYKNHPSNRVSTVLTH
jgi:hypothetical protein